MNGRARCLGVRNVDLSGFPQKYDRSFDPSGWRIQEEDNKPCEIKSLPTLQLTCRPCSPCTQQRSEEEPNFFVKCPRPTLSFKLPPISRENCFARHSRFNETLLGYLDQHDYSERKYYRNFQAKSDLNIIMSLIRCNLCKTYPDETIRYFAFNWPECCIMVSFLPGK